ncbi:hypothetical protein A5725_20045 [Mycobacterium kubicae]|nr:hypothetical protein A5725_20045 [Mycobacterium kubicae]
MLPFRPRSNGSARFAAFCVKFIVVPKGTGAGGPLKLRKWQRELVGSVLDAEAQPRVAGWCLPRGQGKSTLVAALGLYELMTGGEGATVIVVAVDERQAGIVFGVAARMVSLNPDLESRVQVFKDRLVVPSRVRRSCVYRLLRPRLRVWTTRWQSLTRLAASPWRRGKL